ncbi:MAG: TraR/DksA family transcriptional regulator [Candidatus Doudnabacteria bacterium]|nr:TraR/DksA family transcriptional regulator [Candidatus Doudnabacteria bacterium]
MSEQYVQALKAKEAELALSLHNRADMEIQPEPDQIDSVVSAAERDLAGANHDRDTQLLKAVRSALQRINDSTYGTCLHCQEPISPKRLKAIPWAAFCIQCQNKEEKHKQKSHEQMIREEKDAAA